MAFKKGQVGNPKGRPPLGKSLTEVLRKEGNLRPDGSDMTRKELLARELWEIALAGDITAIKYIYDRVDGRPTESVEHSGPDGSDLNIKVSFVKPNTDT